MFPQKYFSDLDKFKNDPYNCQINTKDNLFMINYKKINNNLDDLVRLNGIIVEKESEKIVYYGLDKMNKSLDNFLTNNNSKFDVYELVDGPKIGLYFYNNKWNKCTNKKINASESIWHGPNFEILAQKCFENLDFDKLNKSYCYTFVIQNPECMNFIKYDSYDLRLISVRDLNSDSNNYLKEIELTFIAATFIQFIFASPNKKVNTSICKIVSYKPKDLINYTICIIKSKFSLIYKKSQSIKFDIYKLISNRVNYMENVGNIKNLKSDSYKLDKKFQYNDNNKNLKNIPEFDKLIGQKNIKHKNMDNLLYYLGKKFINLYENYYRSEKKLVEYIDLKQKKVEFLDYPKLRNIYKIKDTIDNINNKHKNKKLFEFKISPKINNDLLNNQYFNDINVEIKDNQITTDIIENYFSKVCLDNLPHNFNYSNFCINCGRSLSNINTIEKNKLGIFKKYYNIYNKTGKQKTIKKIYNHKFISHFGKKYAVNQNEFNLMNKYIVDIYIKFSNLSKTSKSVSSSDTSGEKDMGSKLSTFLEELGIFKIRKSEEIKNTKNDKYKIIIEDKYYRLAMYNIKQYIQELLIIINIIYNKQASINIKNIYGYEYLEKYIENRSIFEPIFEKIIKKYENIYETIDQIIYNEFSNFKNKSLQLRDIFMNILTNIVPINNKDININKFLVDYLGILIERHKLLDINENTKNFIVDEDEKQKKLQYDKIYRITDDEKVELGIDYINLKKITDVEEYQDIIDEVDDYRNKELEYDFDYDSNNADDLPDFEQFE